MEQERETARQKARNTPNIEPSQANLTKLDLFELSNSSLRDLTLL